MEYHVSSVGGYGDQFYSYIYMYISDTGISCHESSDGQSQYVSEIIKWHHKIYWYLIISYDLMKNFNKSTGVMIARQVDLSMDKFNKLKDAKIKCFTFEKKFKVETANVSKRQQPYKTVKKKQQKAVYWFPV